MKIIAPLIVVLVYFFVTGCAASGTNAPAKETPAATSKATARPVSAVTIKHLREHVKYPASRAVVLAACADTPEFSPDEKKWLAESLPERTYGSAEEVAAALHL